jgi:hypothetical protein
MPVTGDDGVAQAIEEARERSELWQWEGYDRNSQTLVLRSWGSSKHRRSWRRDPTGFVVCRSTRYVRLESSGVGLELVPGARASERMQHPPPASALTTDALIVLAHREEREYCVVCGSIEYHTTTRPLYSEWLKWKPVPLAVQGENSLTWERYLGPNGQISHLEKIQGATLEWWGRKLSHAILILVARGVPDEPLALRFNYVNYVDCPTVMHDVRVRMATVEERGALSRRVSPRLTDRFEMERLGRGNAAMTGKEALVAIDCDEGVFFIWAGMLLLSWRDRGRRAPSSGLFDLRRA